jgi:hypothetical protein
MRRRAFGKDPDARLRREVLVRLQREERSR